jgi:hypothetical protein
MLYDAVWIQEKYEMRDDSVGRLLALTPSLNRAETSLTLALSLLKGEATGPVGGDAPALQHVLIALALLLRISATARPRRGEPVLVEPYQFGARSRVAIVR